jgi:hypothetical protein
MSKRKQKGPGRKPSTQKKRSLPLESPHWLPLDDARRLRHEATGNRSLIAGDLTGALLSGHLRCMRRRIGRGVGPNRELVPSSFWAGHRLDSWTDALLVRARTHRGGVVQTLRGFVFYVWKPDLERIWPTAATPSERQADDLRPPLRRRGPVVTHDWFTICGEIARRCIDPKTGRVQVPKSENSVAEAVLNWLADQGINAPAPSEMREAVKRVCAALRTAQK